MSAVGRRVCVADGLADGDGPGEAGVGSVVPGAGALAVLLASGAAIPVTGVGAWDAVAATGAVALEVGIAVDAVDAVDLAGDGEVFDTVGVAARVGVAAPVGAATGLAATGLRGVVVTVGDAWFSGGWPSGGAAD
jgi:hypothetical protein